MALQTAGPIKMSQIKAVTDGASNSLRRYNVVAKAATADVKFDAPDKLSDFYAYGGTTTVGPTTTTTTAAPTTTTAGPIATITASDPMAEGTTYTIQVSTTNFGTGLLYYTISGTGGGSGLTDADFSSPPAVVTNGGTISMTNNVGSFNLTIAADGVDEADEIFTIRIRTGSVNGTVIGTKSIIITGTATTTTAAPTTTTTTAAPTTTTTTAAPTTTTTTKPPLAVTNGAVTCSGTTGTFTSTVTGGTTPYTFIAIADSPANAISAVNGISGTRFAMGGDLSRTWTNIADGTWYVAVRDTAGGQAISSGRTVSCAATTTTTTTAAPTTTTTEAATTTTTAAATTTASGTTWTVTLIAKRAPDSTAATLWYGINNQNTPDGGSSLSLASVTKYTLSVSNNSLVWVNIKNASNVYDVFCAQRDSYCSTANNGPDSFTITADTNIYIQSFVGI